VPVRIVTEAFLTKINILKCSDMQLCPKVMVIGLNLKQFIDMKKTLVLLGCTLLFASVSFAQEKSERKSEKKQDKVKIKVEKNVNGKKEVFEKEIDASGMSEQEKEDMIEHLQDSLGLNLGKQGKLKIHIDEDDFTFDRNENINEDDFSFERKPQVRVYKKRSNGQGFNEFEFDVEKFSDRMKDVYTAIPRRFEHMQRWNDETFSNIEGSAIRSLDVYPNRPDAETLNISFYAAKKGDVVITVLDLKGNIVSKSEVKDFEGDYVGQVKLKSADPGVYFVIVAQDKDGVSRKVKL
jgi:hypothetical protein